MAVTSTSVNQVMKIEYKVGVDSKGEDVRKSQKFDVGTSATDAKILAFEKLIQGVIGYQINSVTKEVIYMISE